jgi:hypothetical protein
MKQLKEVVMKEINTKNILKTLKEAIDSYSDALWHSDLGDTSELETILLHNFKNVRPDFEKMSICILEFIEVIDKNKEVIPETIQYQIYGICSNEEEFQDFGCPEEYEDYQEYLSDRSSEVFEDLSIVIEGVLEHFYKIDVLYKEINDGVLHGISTFHFVSALETFAAFSEIKEHLLPLKTRTNKLEFCEYQLSKGTSNNELSNAFYQEFIDITTKNYGEYKKRTGDYHE